MPSNINDVLIRIRVDNGAVSAAELDRIADSVTRLERRMDDASKSVDRTGESLDKSSKRGQRMRNTLGQIRGAARMGGMALVQMGMQGVAAGLKFNATLDSAKTSFTALLGSSDRAGRLTDRLAAVSSRSPLPLENYMNSAKHMLGFGVSARDVVPYLQSVNKAVVASGKGGPEMEKVAIALGQIKAKGRLTAEGLRGLSQAGIPASKILRKELGLTGKQMSNIGGEGIKADRAIRAITRGWEQQFGPAYKNASKTFDFQWAVVKKQFQKFLGEGLEPVISFLERKALPAGRRFLAWLNKLPNATKTLILGGAVVAGLAIFSGGLALVAGAIIAVGYVAFKYHKQIGNFVGAVVGWVTGAASSVASWVSTAAKNVRGFIGALIPVRVAIGGLRLAFRVLRPIAIGVFKAIREHVKLMAAIFRIGFNAIKIHIRTSWQVIRRVGAIVGNMVAIVSNLLRGNWRGAWNAARRLVSNAFGIIRAVARGAMSFIRTIPRQILSLFKGLPGRVGAVTSGLFNGIKTAFTTAINWVIGKWNGFLGMLRNVSIKVPGIKGIFGGTTIRIPGLPDDITPIGGGKDYKSKTSLLGAIGEGGFASASADASASVVKAGLAQPPDVKVYLDGRQIAHVVAERIDDAAALA